LQRMPPQWTWYLHFIIPQSSNGITSPEGRTWHHWRIWLQLLLCFRFYAQFHEDVCMSWCCAPLGFIPFDLFPAHICVWMHTILSLILMSVLLIQVWWRNIGDCCTIHGFD
jgi:hypothetical protein